MRFEKGSSIEDKILLITVTAATNINVYSTQNNKYNIYKYNIYIAFIKINLWRAAVSLVDSSLYSIYNMSFKKNIY